MSQKRPNRNVEKENGAAKRPRISTDSSVSETENLDQDGGVNENEELSNSDVGVIEHIVLKNFMCHSNLDFKFGSNVNFIVGRNGSGKSAVLTAAVVGLGGSASCTNRGSSVKNFIQNGKQLSEIVIKLNNRGQDAYKPNEYGTAIYVIRQLNMAANKPYRLLNEHKQIISTKKEELNHMLDHFNIQIDNPLCVLNQDASRKFLQSSDPKNFYKLFLKGTQLAQMKDDYESIHTKRGQAGIVLEHKMKAIPILEQEEKEWKKKLDVFSYSEKLLKQKLELYCQLAWSKIATGEKELNDKQTDLETQIKQAGQLSSKVSQYEERKNSCETKHAKAQQEIKLINKKLADLKSSAEQLSKDIALKNSQHRNEMLEAQKLKFNIKQVAIERNELIKKIKGLQNVDMDDLQNKKQMRESEIQNLNAKKREIEENYRDAEVTAQQHKTSILETRSQLNELKQEEGNMQSQLEGIRRRLANLESSRTNYIKLFGDWVPEALNQIDEACRANKFRKKPLGPIGGFVKIVDARWNLAIENCLKNLLSAFCCDNHHDEHVLESILRRLLQSRRGAMPTIITSAFSNSVYNVQQHCAQSNRYPKLLDMLKIDNPVITNCIIDQSAVERILLIENPSEARQTMQRNPPINCSMAYTMEGDQIYPSPKFRIYSSQKDKASILQENVENVIGTLKGECSTLEAEHQALKERIAILESKYGAANRNVKNSDSNLMRLEQSIRRINGEIKELESIEYDEPIKLSLFNEDLRGISSNYETLETNLKICEDNASKWKEEYKKCVKDRQEAEEKLNVLVRDSLEPLKETCAIFEEKKANLIYEHNKFVEQLNKNRAETVVLSQQTKELEAGLEQYIQKCTEEFGPRPANVGKEHDIKREVKRIEDVLANRNSIFGDETEIKQRYKAVYKKLQQIKTDMSSLESFLEKLRISMVHRDEYYNHLRNHLSVKIKQHFVGFLSQREYIGTLQFDHSKEELHVSVKTKPSEVQKNTEVRALSGGERSFSTVSFVLALWDSIESPFRMMDEFDVFMDMVNRRISMDMILRSAKANPSKQFIFLTPLDMNYLKANNSTRIFRMKDPERTQSVFRSQASISENLEEESAGEK